MIVCNVQYAVDGFQRPRTITEGVYQHLRRELLSGRLPPGRPLREQELADRLKVSRTPVREAVRQLAQEGLLATEANRGVWVPEVRAEEAVACYQVRERLEGMAARLAAANADDAGHARLRAQVETMESLAAHDYTGLIGADEAFHHTIATLAANPVLSEMIERLNARIMRVKVLTRDVNASALARAQHREIVDTLEGGHVDAAEDAMTRHVRANLDIVVERLRDILPQACAAPTPLKRQASDGIAAPSYAAAAGRSSVAPAGTSDPTGPR